MRKTFKWGIATVVTVATMWLASSTHVVQGAGEHGSGGKSLVGAWLIDITPTVVPPFKSIGTFGRDGTLTNSSSTSLAFPAGTPGSGVPESPGYGVWDQKGPGKYAATFMTIMNDGAGNFAGTQKVRTTLKVAGDEITGVFQVDVFDAGGNLLVSDTGTVHGRRITLEPL